MNVKVLVAKENHPGPQWTGKLFGIEGNNGSPIGYFEMPPAEALPYLHLLDVDTKEGKHISFAGISLFKANYKSECGLHISPNEIGCLIASAHFAPCEPWVSEDDLSPKN